MSEQQKTVGMDLEIPRTSADPLKLILGPGDRLYIVGANGSGKSALIQYLISSQPGTEIRRIAAHRQTWLESGSIDFTPRRRRQFDRQMTERETNRQARWRDFHGQERQSAVLYDLVAKENSRARSITHHIDAKAPAKAVEAASQSEPPFKQLNELLTLGTLEISLENTNDEEIIARHRGNGASFSITQMSDGERNAAIIAATVLTVKEGTTILIDEPERHLHRSIVEPFLSALFQRRTDCAFVISTHEISLPVAHPETRSLIIRSCTWNGDAAKAWDIDLLDANTKLPEDLKRAVLGSRKRILFVEGDDSNSLDLPLYRTLYPEISILPKGSCGEVLKAVKGLRGSENLHHVEAFGLIDRDDRPDDEVRRLANENVYALDFFSAEALYYYSDAIAAVAHHQAESLMKDADELRKNAVKKALDILKEEGIAERMAARRCERQVRNLLLSELPDSDSIKENPEEPICASIPSPYPDELIHFRALLAENKLDELVARYPLRKSRVFDVIARALHFTGKDNYELTLLSRLQDNSELAQSLRQRIQSLSDALMTQY